MTDDAFHQLALAELDAVFRLACQLAHSSQEAEDFVQETYLRAFRSAASFLPNENGIRPWLFKILQNVIRSFGSRQHRERMAMDEIGHNKVSEPDTPQIGHVDCSSLDWETLDHRLKAAVKELPFAYRVVFLLSAVEGLKYREISAVIEAPVGTVMSRLSRAKAMLAARLVELGSEHGFKSVESTRENAVQDASGSSLQEDPSE